jgi:hypothetical protein
MTTIERVIKYMDENLPSGQLKGRDIKGLVCEAIDGYPMPECNPCGKDKGAPMDYIKAIAHIAFADTIRRKAASVETLGVFKRGKAEATTTTSASEDDVQKQITWHMNRGRSFYHNIAPNTDKHSIL